jgi:hypothetical protein
MRRIVLSRVACVSVTVYKFVKKNPTVYDMSLSHKRTISRKNATELIICVLIFLTTLKNISF